MVYDNSKFLYRKSLEAYWRYPVYRYDIYLKFGEFTGVELYSVIKKNKFLNRKKLKVEE